MNRRLALAGLLTAACGSADTIAVPLEILMPPECWGQPLDRSPFACGGSLRLQLYDQGREVYNQHCSTFSEPRLMSDVPSLVAEADPDFGELPEGASVSLYLEVYSPGIFCSEEPGAPAEPGGDPGPVPDETLMPLVFWGASDSVTLGDGARIEIPLSCGSQPLDTFACTEVRELTARVDDLETSELLDDAAFAAEAIVFSGFPAAVDVFSQERWSFATNGVLDSQGLGFWNGQIGDAMSGVFFPGCVGTLVYGPDTITPIASCDGTDPDGFHAFARAWYLEQTRVDQLAAAAGSPMLLFDGIVLGRVVDDNDNPVGGAWVSAGPGITVKYLDATATMRNSVALTSTSGWFVLDADSYAPGTDRCCRTLTASYGAATADSFAPVGLMEGVVTAVEIKLP